MKIKDIAQMAGVSVATVSRVINNDPKVSDKSRKKVEDAVKKTGYVPNFLGRNLRVSKTQKVLVLLPSLSNPFYAEILTGIENTAAQYGYNVFVGVTHQDSKTENEYMNMLTTKQVDGAIVFLSHFDRGVLNDWAAKYPLVQCCEYTSGAKLSYVSINNEQAAADAVACLAELGHTRIASIEYELYFASANARSRGFRRGLEEAGLLWREEYCIHAPCYTHEGGFDACKQLMGLYDPPTAVVTFGDELSIGASRCLRTMGKTAGKDLAIIGFDNLSVTGMMNPTLSTVAQPRYELGCTAVELLMEKVNDLTCKNRGILLQHELILRESTGVSFCP